MKCPRRPAPRAVRGFTLVELVIAVAILSIASLAAWRSFEQAQQGIGGQLARGLAHQVALNRAAALRGAGLAQGRSLPGEVRMGGRDWTVTIEEASTTGTLVAVTIRVGTGAGPGARLVTFVSPEAPQ